MGWAASRGGEDLGDVPEVGGPEHAGACDREKLRTDAAVILEPVDLAAPDAHRLAGSELTDLAVNRPRADSLEAVDRLLERVVAVRHGHLCIGRDLALEDRHASAGVIGVNKE